jgi:hypothetical protein
MFTAIILHSRCAWQAAMRARLSDRSDEPADLTNHVEPSRCQGNGFLGYVMPVAEHSQETQRPASKPGIT